MTDPRWAPWGLAGASLCSWRAGLPVAAPVCACTAELCRGNISFVTTQEFVISLAAGRSVVLDLCSVQGVARPPQASLRGRNARVYAGRCDGGPGWWAAFDSSAGAGGYVLRLAGDASGTLLTWESNQSLPLWPASSAAAPVGTRRSHMFVLPQQAAPAAVEAASSGRLRVDYFAYGRLSVAATRRTPALSAAALDAYRSANAQVLGTTGDERGYAVFGSDEGVGALLVLASGDDDGAGARGELAAADSLLWWSGDVGATDQVSWSKAGAFAALVAALLSLRAALAGLPGTEHTCPPHCT